MTTVADALSAANGATTAIMATTARIDAIEQGKLTISTQLTALTTQIQALFANASGGGAGSGGGGAGSYGGAGGSGGSSGSGCAGGASGGSGHIPQRRRLDSSGVDKLHDDITISLLRSWRNRWNDFAELSQLTTYTPAEEMAAFWMALDPSMLQLVEVALGIWPTAATSPDQMIVLDLITDYVRAKRNVAFDRVAFEERRQGPAESFDDFYIGLRRLAEAADLCGTCVETRLVTRVIAGVRDALRLRRSCWPCVRFPICSRR